MTAQAPRPLHPAVKVLAGILVACTLVALWTTAAQIKARKLAARYGERIDADPDAPPPELSLKRGSSAKVGHLTLDLDKADGALLVSDAQQHPLVRFRNLKTGDARGWQELQMSVLAADPDSLRLSTDFRPGAPCFGAGDYIAVRPGLRIEFTAGPSITVLSWDPAKPEARVKVGEEELTVTAGQPKSVGGTRLSIENLALRIE